MKENSNIRERALTMERIDTHSHFSHHASDIPDLREMAKSFDDFVETGSMTHSQICALGCEGLYGINPGLFLRSSSAAEIFDKGAELRGEGPRRTLERALDTENITLQFCFCDHRPDQSPDLSSRVRLLAYIDKAIAGDDFAFCPDGRKMQFNYYEALCEKFGSLSRLDDYLGALDEAIDTWRTHGVVGMKTALAYTLGLEFSDPCISDSRSAFSKRRDMTATEVTTVQHYAFRHALLACLRNELPVVIHTGFQIWGHADLRQSNPILLHNLLVDDRYENLKFVLLHGGNPYVGETTYLARMFPSVTIDFTWISWMTRARFRLALAEWIEVVPHGKFCWGSDSSSPEDIVGIGRLTREVIADVLEDLISRRVIDEGVAFDFLEHTFMKTPKRIFGV